MIFREALLIFNAIGEETRVPSEPTTSASVTSPTTSTTTTTTDLCHPAGVKGKRFGCSELNGFIYDVRSDDCHPVPYGGCFKFYKSCLYTCAQGQKPFIPQEIVTIIPLTETEAPSTSLTTTAAGVIDQETCLQQPPRQNCSENTVRYAYNAKYGKCGEFYGCEGEGNNFGSVMECLKNCNYIWYPDGKFKEKRLRVDWDKELDEHPRYAPFCPKFRYAFNEETMDCEIIFYKDCDEPFHYYKTWRECMAVNLIYKKVA
ncbi:unnamed protein product [Cylicocyclus nassatus]|uniref:BPTI/Kunitz inhibitor domain-containing protein n=1 Tax=Cylicocyclus nassatus TaxID=53992 RepID=A0AA36HBD2_CYLNA|nr:unnamed protein product [Cylicocyclus nassatus]